MPTTIPAVPIVFEILEQTTPKYTATITDDAGVAIPAASLTTLTIRLWVLKSDGTTTYIRGSLATGQSVLNANNTTVSAGGAVVWSLQAADTTLVEDLPFERHVAVWEWTWGTARVGRHEAVFNIQRLAGI